MIYYTVGGIHAWPHAQQSTTRNYYIKSTWAHNYKYVVVLYSVKFWLGKILTRENFDIFDDSQLDCQNLTCQIFKIITVFIGAWWKTVIIRQNIFQQILERLVSIKHFPCQNVALYSILLVLLLSNEKANNSRIWTT